MASGGHAAADAAGSGCGGGGGAARDHSRRQRKREPCCIPGCTHRALYVCAHCEANGGGDGTGGMNWYCKSHRCPSCVRADDGGVGGDGCSGGAAIGGTAMRPDAGAVVDAARIADAARTALVRMHQQGEESVDPYAVYGFRCILELCGPVHGEVHVCACGHPLSSHHAGAGRCRECGQDTPCGAMRRRQQRGEAQPSRGGEPAGEARAH